MSDKITEDEFVQLVQACAEPPPKENNMNETIVNETESRAHVGSGTALGDWLDIEKVEPPKTGEEFLTCNMRQGGVLRLVRFDRVHDRWMCKGEVIFLQETHWMRIPAKPSNEPVGYTVDTQRQLETWGQSLFFVCF